MTNFQPTLPDRQTIYMLQFLVQQLEADAYLQKEHPGTHGSVINQVVARWPVEKQGNRLKIINTGLPCLALYSDMGSMDEHMIINGFGSSDTFHLEYVFDIPGPEKNFDGQALALAWVKKVWWQAVYHLRSRAASAMCNNAGILDIRPGKWQVRLYPNANVLVLDGQMAVDHVESACTPEQLLDLHEIAVTLNLYGQDGADTGYDVTATFDPSE